MQEIIELMQTTNENVVVMNSIKVLKQTTAQANEPDRKKKTTCKHMFVDRRKRCVAFNFLFFGIFSAAFR